MEWRRGVPMLGEHTHGTGISWVGEKIWGSGDEGNVSEISMPTWALERLLALGLNLHPGT